MLGHGLHLAVYLLSRRPAASIHLATFLPCSAPHVLQGFLGYGFRASKTSGVNLLRDCFQALRPRGPYACKRLFVFWCNQIRFQIETGLSFKACLSALQARKRPIRCLTLRVSLVQFIQSFVGDEVRMC